MTPDKEYWELLRKDLTEGLQAFRAEVKSGFTDLTIRVDQTNARLDHTNERLDQTVDRLDQTVDRLDQTVDRLNQTNDRLDQTNIRLDAAINMVRDFRKDVSGRLDGIGSHLLSINGNILKHEERIQALESRVDRLEDAS